MSLRDLLFGRALASGEDEEEKVGSVAGVPILGLDALASAAYGPEALLTVLLPLGAAGLVHVTPITLLLVALLAILFLSYRRTIDAYPSGGGAYTVAKENLGNTAALFAAAALALDYLLNVAVAISAGVGALVSDFPSLLPHTLAICLALLVVITLVNLRGVRASGAIFSLPTYVFVGSLSITIALGLARVALHGGHAAPVSPPPSVPATMTTASTWLLVRAFASGCTAMTGVEAVSNGVPIFRDPSSVRAKRTLTGIVTILAALLVGVALLCRTYGITATPPGKSGYQSVLSLAVAAVFGRGVFFHVTIASVVAVLCLSANTSFAGLPRLCSMLAVDRYLPESFMHRGRRLVFSHGILVLSTLAAVLLVVFGGVTDALIPLFAIGAFLAFTLSQAGMAVHAWKRGVRRSAALSLVGAIATGITLSVVLASKMREGAWITVLLVAAMLMIFRSVRRHYAFIATVTDASHASLELGPPRQPIVVVPMRRWDAVALKGLRFALGMSSEVIAVQVLTGDVESEDLSSRWEELAERPANAIGLSPPRLVVLHSEYRRLFEPLLGFLDELEKENPDRKIAVVVPELVERRWYYYFLHNHTASVLKALLLLRGGPQVVIISAPWYLADWAPERAHVLTRRPSYRGRMRRQSHA